MAVRKRIKGKCYTLVGTAKTKADVMKKGKSYTKGGQNVIAKKRDPYEIWVEC